MADEFDMSFFMDKKLATAFSRRFRRCCPGMKRRGWPTAVIPLQIGVLQFPVPSARRCYKLGQALRRAIESFPEDINVAIVATGGLSHQVHGERCGFNNPDWDAQFVDMLVNDPEKLTEMTLGEYAELGGDGGVRSDHVAGDARRAISQCHRNLARLLPAVDDRYRHADP